MTTKPLTFISLFAGIGGFDLALERAGLQCVAQVEIDAKARAVLHHHWPSVPQFEDVRQVGAHNLPPADVIGNAVAVPVVEWIARRLVANFPTD